VEKVTCGCEGERYTTCADCGCELARDDARNGYCESCYDERYTTCEACGCELARDDARNGYCESCYDERYTTCDDCGCELARDDARVSGDGDSYCESCYDERYTTCEDCGCELARDDAYGDGYCESCYGERYTTCADCDCELLRDDAYGDGYCESCYDAHHSDTWDHGHFVPDDREDEIGSHRCYGVEIETSACPDHIDLRGETTFDCREDGSIDGKEFTSPILRGDKGLEEIRAFCRLARRFEVNGDCGLHIHLDMRGESAETLARICHAYYLTAEVWASFVPTSRRMNSYCKPVGWDIDHFDGCCDAVDFRHRLPGDRYCWFNAQAYSRHRTFEIRLHTASTDPEKIVNWVKAHTRFCDWAAQTPIEEIDCVLAHATHDTLTSLWNDSELATYYADRADKFANELVEV